MSNAAPATAGVAGGGDVVLGHRQAGRSTRACAMNAQNITREVWPALSPGETMARCRRRRARSRYRSPTPLSQ